MVCTLYNSYIIISPRAKRFFFSNDGFRVVITLQGSNIFDKFDSLLSTISRKGPAFFSYPYTMPQVVYTIFLYVRIQCIRFEFDGHHQPSALL